MGLRVRTVGVGWVRTRVRVGLRATVGLAPTRIQRIVNNLHILIDILVISHEG